MRNEAMGGHRLVKVMHEIFRRFFLIGLAVGAFGLIQSVEAQSGRRKPVTGPGTISTPTVANEPAKAPPVSDERADDPNVKITSILVTGEIAHPYAYYKSSFLGSAIKECVNALKKHPVAAAKAGEIDFTKAKELAKKETEVYVLWLGFETKDDGAGNQILDYVDYAVLVPKTAKILTNGRIEPGEASPAITRGGVLSLPRTRTTTRSSPVQANRQMRFVADEVVNRLKLGGWID